MNRFSVITATVLGLTLAGTSHADDIGPVGSVVSVQTYTSSADGYLAYHGRAFVRSIDDGTVAEYRWGGSACGTKQLSEAQVAALQQAFENKKTLIQPTTLPGQGLSLCLVGFQFVQKKYLGILTP
jgi:hypothetical protein